MADDWDWIHTEIHALRLIQNYKASVFEQKLNKFISEKFQGKCKECKEKFERLKYQPIEPQKKGFDFLREGIFK